MKTMEVANKMCGYIQEGRSMTEPSATAAVGTAYIGAEIKIGTSSSPFDDAPSEDQIHFSRYNPMWQQDLTFSSISRVHTSNDTNPKSPIPPINCPDSVPPSRNHVNNGPRVPCPRETSFIRSKCRKDNMKKTNQGEIPTDDRVNSVQRVGEMYRRDGQFHFVASSSGGQSKGPVTNNRHLQNERPSSEMGLDFLLQPNKTFVCQLCQVECPNWYEAVEHTGTHGGK